jgi:hypothetical protein
MKELQKHIDAFDQYFILKQNGVSTTEAIRSVMGQWKVSEKSAFKWKREFKWDEKEAVRSVEVNQKVEKKTNNTIVDNKIKYLSFYHKLLDDLKNNFDIKIESVTDLKKTVDGCLVLQGEVNERLESRVVVERLVDRIDSLSDEEYVEVLRNGRIWGVD